MDLDAVVEDSVLSEARYVYCEDATIRVASHDSRPTYELQHGAADFTVGTVVRRTGRVEQLIVTSDGDWLDAVAWLARRYGRVLPVRYRRLIASRNEAVSRYEEGIKAQQEARRNAALAGRASVAEIRAWARGAVPDLLARLIELESQMGIPGEGRRCRRRRKTIWGQIVQAYDNRSTL